MSSLEALRDATDPRPVVAIVGGAVAGSEAAVACAEGGAIAVVFEQGVRPYGKIEDGLPRWHVKLRKKEYAKIDANLTAEGVIFVPATRIGADLRWEELYPELGFTAIILANGAWSDRPMPVPGIERFESHGLIYQNPFVYWFNHYEDEGYQGPQFDVADDTVVVGGGLASIDVIKIVNLELYGRALRARGIEVDVVEMEVKGIPRTLEAHGVAAEELGIQGCTLYYRRRKEDMPLASADDPTPEQRKKLELARVKIMDRVMRKYLVRFRPLCRPIKPIAEGPTLSGLRFQETEVVDGRVQGIEGSEFDVTAPLVISSIGSIPRAIEGIPTKGELYDFADWDTGELRDLPGVFGLGNVLTGKGNIKDSRENAVEIVERVVSAYVGVGGDPEEVPDGGREAALNTARQATRGQPMQPEAMRALANRIQGRHTEVGYESYQSWIAKHPLG